MANEEQLSILKQGVDVWNKWREEHPDAEIDLTQADLSGAFLFGANLQKANLSEANLSLSVVKDLKQANLKGANLRGTQFISADLSQADLSGADLKEAQMALANLEKANFSEADLSRAVLMEAYLDGANLSKANLSEAELTGANLRGANLCEANLFKANLMGANLSSAKLRAAYLHQASLSDADLVDADLTAADLHGADLAEADFDRAKLRRADLRNAYLIRGNFNDADLTEADLTEAELSRASFVGTIVDKAKISGSWVYGINIWDLQGRFEEQKDLGITPGPGPAITVDNIKVAQFIYLILNNEEIRDVINTLTSKTVLILGRFSDVDRKATLNALRTKLREYDLLPMVFDFDRPIDRNVTETVKTLAAISYFVVADVTSPKSSPLELQAIVPDYQIPVVPIIQEDEIPFSMIADLQSQYNGVLDPLTYHSRDTLINVLKTAVIDPAIAKHQELRLIKAQKRNVRSAEDLINDTGLDSPSN